MNLKLCCIHLSEWMTDEGARWPQFAEVGDAVVVAQEEDCDFCTREESVGAEIGGGSGESPHGTTESRPGRADPPRTTEAASPPTADIAGSDRVTSAPHAGGRREP